MEDGNQNGTVPTAINNADGTNGNQTPQQQMEAMQQLLNTQIQMMQLQLQKQQLQQPTATLATITTATPVPSTVKNVKVPEGRLDMNPNEFRTFAKDCRDYKKLTLLFRRTNCVAN